MNRPQRLLLWFTASVLLLTWAFPQVNIGYYRWNNPRTLDPDFFMQSRAQQATQWKTAGAWETDPFYVVRGGHKPLSDIGQVSDASSDETLEQHTRKKYFSRIGFFCSSGCEKRIAIDWRFQILCSVLAAAVCLGAIWALKTRPPGVPE